MKTLALAFVLLLGLSRSALATPNDLPLDKYHIYVPYSVMIMQHVTFEVDDAGYHLGLAGYRHMGKNWHLGTEIGTGGSTLFIGGGSSFFTWEVNGKRAFDLGGAFRWDIGAGLSYNNVTIDGFDFFYTSSPDISDWVLGVQALTDLNLKLGGFLLGAHVKYMLTQDVAGVELVGPTDKGWDYSNVTFGIQGGFLLH